MQIYLHFFINKSKTGLLASKLTRLLFYARSFSPENLSQLLPTHRTHFLGERRKVMGESKESRRLM